ncbi:MAG: RNase P modulator RnpM [Chloroflexota bacterium]
MSKQQAMTRSKRNQKTKQRAKHIPIRTCIACGRKDAKREYVRLVRSPDDMKVRVDPTGKANGRGAYLCASRACWKAALEKNAISASLKVKVDQEDRDRLWEYARTHFPPDSENES